MPSVSNDSSFRVDGSEKICGPKVPNRSEANVRDKMKQYWKQYDATPKSMMLCSAANDSLAEEDRSQVLKCCPDLKGRDVLELGAGIGRFTTELSKICKKVTAVDFISDYVEENRRVNGHQGHVDFLAADVTEIDFPNNSYDIIFSNWLLMYISDEELENLVTKMLSWLRNGGYLFVRESCFRPSGDVKRQTNPTYYRSPLDYFKVFKTNRYTNSRGQQFSFVCERAISMKPYITHYGNPFQLGFVLKKMPHAADSYDSFQAFLDGQQYTEEGIKRYECIFGKTYVSTGGQATTTEFVKELNLTKDSKVLDVGCGIGGSAFHIAREYGAKVHGVDLSSNMISEAIRYQSEMEENVRKNVSFEMSDITKQEFEPECFDVIYSRDTILHIGDKEKLFSNFFKWLKPGGTVMITDYCHGTKEFYSEEFMNYVLQRGYHLVTVPDYGALLEKVGFVDIKAEDRTIQFMKILNTEMKNFAANQQDFVEKFKQTDFDYIMNGWNAKVKRCDNGDQVWGYFVAKKPQ